MNERYLYRGKRIDSGEWIIGHINTLQGKDWYILPYNNGLYGLCEAIYVDPATIGQCTGLQAIKSYRGNRPEDLLIFEGDILKQDNDIRVVEWTEAGHLDYGWTMTNGCCRVSLDYIIWNSDFSMMKIIGNIHDTPKEINVSDSDTKGGA